MTTNTPSKAHVDRVRKALRRASDARDRFAGTALELAERRDWVVDPQYRDTWTRLNAEYEEALAAWREAVL